MYETASKRVKKSKRCVLFVTFRPSQRTLFMARRNWVPLALSAAYRVIVIKLFCIVVYMALAQNWTSRGFI